MLYRNICQCCGGNVEKVGEKYICEFCNTTYSAEKFENYADKISQLFDDFKLEMISNARKNLYKAITAQYISSEEVYSYCVEIKKYLPDDFQANFYEAAVNSAPKNVAKLISQIDEKEYFDNIELILNFLINSLALEWVTPIAALIERTYKETNLIKYNKYSSMLESETEKIDDCIYLTTYPRDVFVAYSSKDIDKALELVDVLEEQGLSCFISIRNLRHGAGSRENYEKALQEAMDNCASFVFVSSMNSRSQACDALKVEIPYIKRKDIENAKGYAQASYANIPHELKKSRVEYRLEESNRLLAADRIVDEFFAGYERVYSPIDVAERVMRQFSTSILTQQNTTQIDILKLVEEQVRNQREVEKRKQEELEKANREAEFSNESSKGLEFKLNSDGQSYMLIGLGFCTQTDIIIDRHKGKPVTIIGTQVFKNQKNICSVQIGEHVTSIGESAFEGCSSLITVIIPNQVITLGSRAFYGCSNLSSVVIGACVKYVGDHVFEGCFKLAEIIDKSSLDSDRLNEIAKYSLEIHNGNSKLLHQGEYLFYAANSAYYLINYVGNEKKLMLPQNCNGLDYVINAFAFYNCSNLIEVIIPDGITGIGDHAFEGCNWLTEVVIPKSVTYIGGSAFYGCRELKSITIPDSVVSIGNHAFAECSWLSNIKMSNNLTNIGKFAFSGCNGLREITIPDSVMSIGYGVFRECNNLVSITIPFVGVMCTNGTESYEFASFFGVKASKMNFDEPPNIPKKLKNVIITKGTSIGKGAFFKCKEIINITIPNTVKSISENAFSECDSLKSIVIPNSVKTIYNAFEKCDNLNTIYCFKKLEYNRDYRYKVCYYKEKKPLMITSKRYWHYVDGVPTEW